MNPPPSIRVADESAPRPLWSVMVPTYNPEERYLEQTLRSVLEQDPGPDSMQIRIIDDASPESFDLEAFAERLAPGRIEVERRPANGGMAATWNACVENARGEWVHILHQDDLALPGFYEHLRRGIDAHPELGAAYVQHYMIDSNGERNWLMSQNPAKTPGIVEDWVRYVFVELSFQTPSIVVKREVYEKLGGFRPEMRYALDWDMWKRLAAAYPIWFDPTPLACYRRHNDGASMGFFSTGGNMKEVRASIEMAREYLPGPVGDQAAEASLRHYAGDAVDMAMRGLLRYGRPDIAKAQLREALRFGVRWRIAPMIVSSLVGGLRRWMKARFVGV